MALIKCPECGRDVSGKAESCPNCGFPIKETKEFTDKVNSIFVINGVQFDIEEIKKSKVFDSVSSISKKVKKICKCEQSRAEEVVYGYFLSTHGEFTENIENLRNKIKHIKSFNGKNIYCPYCLSTNINIKETVSESISRGKSEVRKKSAITRAGNKAGRAGMIMMTGGLWSLTPKKSKYNEVSESKVEYHTKTTKTCMDCGRQIL